MTREAASESGTKSEATGSRTGGAFTLTVEGGVAWLVMDVPGQSVNTLTAEMSSELESLLARLGADGAVKALVILSGKKDGFIAGADIDMLAGVTSVVEATAIARRAQEAFNRLDELEKPVVAAINGACLGGGFELALACDYRLATDNPKTSLGLPEIQLGLIPAAGGTQRLPKLVGAQQALDLILPGKALKAKKALKAGLVDEVVPTPILREVAGRRALELAAGTLRPARSRGQGLRSVSKGKGVGDILRGLAHKETWAELALEDNPVGRKILFEQAKRMLFKKTRGKYPAPEKALEAIRAGLEGGMGKGLEVEARLFGELVVSETSKRLVEIFKATTALKKENGVANPDVKPREVRKLAIVGGGLMGGGIAFVAANQQEVSVRIKDKDDAGVARALTHVRGLFDERVRKKSLTWREAAAREALVTAATDYSGFKTADLVVEAVFEDLELKRKVLSEVEALTRGDCIFASNTSSISIAKIAEASARPEMVIGMHYFSPVNKMPLLEVVVQPRTADWVTATCVEVGKRQGKSVIVVNDGVGFYTTRTLAPFMNEAVHLLTEGADVAELDKALVEFGFPVGPAKLLDEVGIDVGAKVARIMNEAFGDRFSIPDGTAKLIADGRLGRKAKRGLYLYGEGNHKEVDTSVYELFGGRERKHLPRQEMAERCVLQFVNEAIRCLGDGVLRSPRDGDIGAIFGLGFPPFLGGPFRYADQWGPLQLLERLDHFQLRYGRRFEPAPLLSSMVKAGKRFYS